jgi:hypothetical protein
VGDTGDIVILRVGAGAPELWLVAGVHGDEVEGIACVEEALQSVRPARGTLVGVPVAHPAALAAGTRLGPDGVDLNRVYPGRPDAGPTERVAHALWSRLSESADALLTIHSWSRSGCVAPYVEYADGDALGLELAHRLGLPFAEPWNWPDGLLPKVAVAAGIPAVEIELGGLGRQTLENLELGLEAIRHAAAWLGLRETEPAARPTRTVRRRLLHAGVAGRVRQLRALGEEVAPGEAVCELRGNDGRVVETVESPAAGWVGAHLTYGYVGAGDEAALVFEAAAGG